MGMNLMNIMKTVQKAQSKAVEVQKELEDLDKEKALKLAKEKSEKIMKDIKFATVKANSNQLKLHRKQSTLKTRLQLILIQSKCLKT